MSNNTRRKAASDSDLMILIPLACIVSVLAFVATSMVH
jgi:hypothetical protein